jgi:hypothetical protein
MDWNMGLPTQDMGFTLWTTMTISSAFLNSLLSGSVNSSYVIALLANQPQFFLVGHSKTLYNKGIWDKIMC